MNITNSSELSFNFRNKKKNATKVSILIYKCRMERGLLYKSYVIGVFNYQLKIDNYARNDYTHNNLSLACFRNRKSGSDAAHILVQHGLPRLAVPVPQRSRRTHPVSMVSRSPVMLLFGFIPRQIWHAADLPPRLVPFVLERQRARPCCVFCVRGPPI